MPVLGAKGVPRGQNLCLEGAFGLTGVLSSPPVGTGALLLQEHCSHILEVWLLQCGEQ